MKEMLEPVMLNFRDNVIDPGLSNHLLYDLCFTLAGPESVLDPEHLATCMHLWNKPYQRPWLAAALLRRCEPGPGDSDDATLRFVARRLAEDLKIQPAPDIAELSEFIPAFMLMFSEEAWASPTIVWNELLRVSGDQLHAATAEVKKQEAPFSRTRRN